MNNPLTKKSGIYKIKCASTSKIYIGSATQFGQRWSSHRKCLRANNHHSPKLQNAWNKYGEEDFIFSVIEEVEDKSNLLLREQYYLDTLKPEYNCSLIAGSRQGMMNSNTHRKRISEALNTPESQAKLSARWKGKKQSEEHKAARAHAMIGNTNGSSNKNRIISEETKIKMSEAAKKRMGRVISEATKEKIRQSLIGHKVSEESRLKMSLAKKK